jgi:hypothetical protein
VPRSTRPVIQGDGSFSLPLRRGVLDVEVWTNLQGTESTGDGVFPDGRGGEFTEIDFALSWSEAVDDTEYGFGLIDYNFPNLVARSTSETWVALRREFYGYHHEGTLYLDFHEAEGFYASYRVSRVVSLKGGWALDVGAMLGLMSDEQAEFYFGVKDGGFSDISLSATVSRAWDEVTTIFFGATLVTVPDGGLSDALDMLGADDTGLIFTAGATFGL